MKKKWLFGLACMMILTGCRTNGRQIDANFDTSVYKDYMTEDNKINNLNYLMTNDEKNLSLLGNLVDGLVETDKYGNLKPAIAQDNGRTVSNSSVWEFDLRDDIPWVDAAGEETGSYVTADDFVCGIQYVLDNKDSDYFEEITSLIKNAKEYSEGKVGFDEVGVKATDTYTVRYTLTSNCEYFNTYLLNGGFYPVSRQLLNDLGDNFATSPSMMWYNGAYHLTSMSDELIQYKKNTHYWEVGQVSFESGSIELVKDNEEALNLFKRGKLSYAYIDSDYAEDYSNSIDSHMYMSATSPETYLYVFNFDTTNDNLKTALTNESFRKAILSGMDVENSYVAKSSSEEKEGTQTKQDAEPNSTIVPFGFATNSKGVDYLDLGTLETISSKRNYDEIATVDYASQAKTELGDKVTWPVEIGVPMEKGNTIALSEFERAIANFDSTFVVFKVIDYTEDSEKKDIPSFAKTISNNDYGMVLMDIHAENGEPSTYISHFLLKDDFNTSYMNLNDKMYDGLYQAATSIKNADERLLALAECEAYLINKAYAIPFSHGKLTYKVSSINDYSMPRGTYGLSRFKLKGVKATENAITLTERVEMKAAYDEAKNAAI